MRRGLGVTMSIVAVLVLGLGGGASAKKVSIRWCTWLGGAQLKAMQDLGKIFQKENPNIEVRIESGDYTTLKQRLFLQYAAGTAPDVFHSTVNMADEFIRRGMLADVTGLVKSTIDLKKYIPLSPTYFKQGKTWGGFETHNQVYPTFYNIDMFNQAGVQTPDKFVAAGKWDWNTYRDTAAKLTKDTNGDGKPEVWGTFIYSWWGNTEPHWGQWVASNDATWINAKRTKLLLDQPAVEEAIKEYFGLALGSKLSAAPNSVAFETRKCAMKVDGTWSLAQLDPVRNLNWDITFPPKGPRADRFISCISPGADAIVSSGSKHPKEAWAFVKFLLSKDAQMAKASERLTVPVLREALESKEFNRSKNTAVIQKLLDNPPSWELEVFEGFDDVNKAIDAEFQKALAKKISVDAAIQNAQREGQKQLDKINNSRRSDRKK